MKIIENKQCHVLVQKKLLRFHSTVILRVTALWETRTKPCKVVKNPRINSLLPYSRFELIAFFSFHIVSKVSAFKQTLRDSRTPRNNQETMFDHCFATMSLGLHFWGQPPWFVNGPWCSKKGFRVDFVIVFCYRFIIVLPFSPETHTKTNDLRAKNPMPTKYQ